MAWGVMKPKTGDLERVLPFVESRGRTVTVKGSDECIHEPLNEQIRLVPRTIVPKEWIQDEAAWTCVQRRRCKFVEHINVGELRGPLAILEAITRHAKLFRSRLVHLVDNRVTVGCLGKGRSPSWPLLRLLRRRASMTLATGVRLSPIWTTSKTMPMDSDSRLR